MKIRICGDHMVTIPDKDVSVYAMKQILSGIAQLPKTLFGKIPKEFREHAVCVRIVDDNGNCTDMEVSNVVGGDFASAYNKAFLLLMFRYYNVTDVNGQPLSISFSGETVEISGSEEKEVEITAEAPAAAEMPAAIEPEPPRRRRRRKEAVPVPSAQPAQEAETETSSDKASSDTVTSSEPLPDPAPKTEQGSAPAETKKEEREEKKEKEEEKNSEAPILPPWLTPQDEAGMEESPLEAINPLVSEKEEPEDNTLGPYLSFL